MQKHHSFSAGGPNSSPGGPIPKKKGLHATQSTEDIALKATKMGTINEHDVNDDVGMSTGFMEESVKDPHRDVQIIKGLTDFLKQEYSNVYGIYCADVEKLFQFWKSHVSIHYKEQRKLQQKKRQLPVFGGLGDIADYQAPAGYSTGFEALGTGIPERPGCGFGAKYKNKSVAQVKRQPPKLREGNFLQQYQFYGSQLEMDVSKTIEHDIDLENDKKKSEEIEMQATLNQERTRRERKSQQEKMRKVLEAFYDHKKFEKLEAEYKTHQKEQAKKAREAKKSKDADSKPKKDDDGYSDDSFEDKPAAVRKPHSAKKPLRPGSAAPASASQKLEKGMIHPGEKVLPKSKVDSIKEELTQEMEEVFALMKLAQEFQMTNEPAKILSYYEQNKDRCSKQIRGGETGARSLLTSFFSDANVILRLQLYRDKINTSRRRGDVPLLAFYINIQPEDRLYYMIHKKKVTNKRSEAEAPGKKERSMQDIIEDYEKEQKELMEAAHEARLKKLTEKKTAEAKVLGKSVFGKHFDESKLEPKLKNRPDPAQPKDKWKLGRELKNLQKQFPHDRVIERMIEEEFKTN